MAGARSRSLLSDRETEAALDTVGVDRDCVPVYLVVPDFRTCCTLTIRTVLLAGSREGGPVGTRTPALVASAMPEKRGSMLSLNWSRISAGEAVTVPPTGGTAPCNSA